jgi:beta-galactosidase
LQTGERTFPNRRFGWPREVLLAEFVYSNCDQAELFLNGKSLGTNQRDSQSFPAAGLRWKVAFATGPNRLHIVATRGTITVTDEIELSYQTELWGKPAELRLHEQKREANIITVGAMVFDAKGPLSRLSRLRPFLGRRRRKAAG